MTRLGRRSCWLLSTLVLMVTILLLASAVPAGAQVTSAGQVNGVVTDKTGAVGGDVRHRQAGRDNRGPFRGGDPRPRRPGDRPRPFRLPLRAEEEGPWRQAPVTGPRYFGSRSDTRAFSSLSSLLRGAIYRPRPFRLPLRAEEEGPWRQAPVTGPRYFGSRSDTRAFSSLSSFSVAAIFDFEKSVSWRPWTMLHLDPSLRMGKEKMRPFSIP